MEKPRRKALKIIKCIFVIACLFILLTIASLFGISEYVKASVKNQIITVSEASTLNADCILVLGAGVFNGQPSPMLTDRLLEGINLYKSGASKKLLMSGDHGQKDYDEVNTMKQFAMDYDIPSQDIFMDHAGFSTYESMYRARDIFQAQKIIIVTQEYHLYRALYVANALGLEAYGVPSDPREYYGQEYREAREVLARLKDFFMAIFKPLPTYLGEVIPVSGNGDLTND